MFRSNISCYLLMISWLILYPGLSISQQIEKNDHVNYTVKVVDGNYEISYRFKDQFHNYQTYNLTMPFEETNMMIGKFGIPLWMFEPYVDNEPNRFYRETEMAKGLFLLKNNTIEVDKSAVLSYYSEVYAKPIAKMIASSLEDYGRDTRRDRIEFAIRFIQDIPYGVPEYKNEETHFGGVYVPPQVLIKGYGDCDSKVLLFVGILTYLLPADDIIFLNQKEHVLSAIIEKPEKGLTFVHFRNEDYLIAETAGPGKRMLGEKGTYFRESFNIETLHIKAPEVIPHSENTNPRINPNIISQVNENVLMIRNGSSREFQFEISPDNYRWENLNLDSKQSGQYVFDRKLKIFLRFRESRRKYSTYQVSTGKTYTVIWNNRRNKWELSIQSI